MKAASLVEIVRYADGLLGTASMPDYPNALNGLQCENSGRVTRIAAAVDACEWTIQAAIGSGADLLLVHHGLFWGGLQPFTGAWGRKMRALAQGNLAVFSAHLPLDAHPGLGNNVLLGKALGLGKLVPFFPWQNVPIGFRAAARLPLAVLEERLKKAVGGPVTVVAGGPPVARRIGIVTGGAGGDVAKAAAGGIDTFISGEAPHHAAALAEELGVNLLLGGHYATETFGVKALAAHLAAKYRISWEFIDHPSGL